MENELDPKALAERIRILESENLELKKRISGSNDLNNGSELEKFKTLYHSSSDAIFLIENATGQIIEANNTAVEMYGYSHSELVNLKNTDLSHEPEQTRKVTVTGAPVVLERWHRKKDGTVFPVEITGSFFDYNGKSVHIAAIRDISKRISALESLRVNEKLFRSYFDLSLVGVAITKPNMEWIKVNSKLCDMLGYSFDEILTKTWADLTPKEDLRQELIRFNRAIQNPEFRHSQFTKRLIRKDGLVIIVDVATTVHRNESGEIDFLISMIHDITQKIETEVALIESELKFKDVVNLLPQTVFETDKNGLFKFINKYAEQEFKYNLDEVFEKLNFIDTLTPSEQKRFFDNYKGIPETGSTGREYIFQRKDGTTFTGLVHYTPIVRNGDVLGMIGIVTNIEQQKLTEKAIRESEENYRTIFELANDSIMIHDPETAEVIDANQNAVSSYGLKSLKELQEYEFWTEEQPYSFNDVLKWIKKATTEGPQTFEWLNRRIDGTFFWEEVHLSYAKILGVNRVISISRNISARKKAEERLEQANKELKFRNEEYAALNEEFAAQNEELLEAKEKAEDADRLKSAFLANMSHEIRTPMNAIMGFAGLLASKSVDSEKQNLYAQIIKRRSTDLLKIIDDILDISKIEANQLEINESNGNINELFDELLSYFLNKKEMDNKQGIEIKVLSQLNENDARIVTDIGRLKQILFNLAENAFKFTEKGFIEVSCEASSNNMLHFTVKDTGTGIDPSMHEIIFQRFRQVAEQHNDVVSGTGLGLAISKGLVELLGGQIWVKSELNIGSEFHFTIPKKQQSPSGELIETKTEETKNLKGKTILVVEDDENNTHFLREVLDMAKAFFVCALDGKSSIEILKSSPTFDAILLDIKLPDINGLELIPQYHAICPGTPVIVQSAYATQADIDAGYKAGCDAYLTKPTDAIVLVTTIIEKINSKIK